MSLLSLFYVSLNFMASETTALPLLGSKFDLNRSTW